MRIDSLSVSPVIPKQPVDDVDPKLPEAGTDRQAVLVAEDPTGAAATEFGVRRIENDLHALNIKARIGAAGASTVPGGPVVLSSRTDAAAGVTPGGTGAVHQTPPASTREGKPGAQEQPAAAQEAPKPAAKQTVNEQIRELMEWENKGLIEGNTHKLKARLRSKDPKVQAEAQKEFEHIKRDIQ